MLVEFLFMVLARAANLLRGYRWPEVNARVLSAECPEKTKGCSVVTIDYLYSIEDKKYHGSYSKPFIQRTSAQIYAHILWSRGFDELAKVNPKNPSASVYHGY
ncbi:MAG TPA: hypothetical protein VLV89_01380 [Candidatus Acidoferrum sp.]|nr:hypothetical protein [Candidatus Acidoferrum sp.]